MQIYSLQQHAKDSYMTVNYVTEHRADQLGDKSKNISYFQNVGSWFLTLRSHLC
jgi:hypothetical protein